MVQAARRSRFLLEPAAIRRVLGELRRQDLDRDVALQLGIAGPVHLAHPARAQRADDLEPADTMSDGKGHSSEAAARL